MTDITELAQREKFENWARSQQLSLAYGDCGYFYSSTEMAWRAVKAQSAELVEALEKAQHRIDELENDEVRQRLANAEHQLYMAELAKHNLKASRKAQFCKRRAAEKRIAELEEAEQKLCAANVTLDARAELAERQLAELESRSVTVKLLDDEDGQAYGFGKWSNGKLPATAGTMTIAYCEDAWRAAFEVFASAVGIKWEAE